MEVSNEIKEDIRKTQSDLKNAIRVHQVWVTRLQEDENNLHLKSKVKEAENEIVAIGQAQKLVVDRLRRELELYQQRLKARNKQTNIENDNRYVAQQLRDHQLQYRSRNRTVSLLKPSVLNEIHIKSENYNDAKENISDSEIEIKTTNEKENSNHSDAEDKEKYLRNYQQIPKVHDSRNNFANALNKVKEAFIGGNLQHAENNWQQQHRSDSDSSQAQLSPTPSPPPLPQPGEPVSQELFMRLIGLVTPAQKEVLEKKRSERRKRSTTTTNRNDFLYGNYEMLPKRKKYNQFPYLQSHNDPPQTRSAKLRKQQTQSKESREGSPSGSSAELKAGWSNGKPAWVASLPAGLSVEPVYSSTNKVCNACGRNDVPSLLVWCTACGVWLHTGCGAAGRCGCGAALPDPAAHPAPVHQLFRGMYTCGRRVPSLLVWCTACGVWLHTGCGAAGRCGCGAALPDPAAHPAPVHQLFRGMYTCGRRVPSLLVWCTACGVWLHTGCGAAGRCGCGAALPDPAAHPAPVHQLFRGMYTCGRRVPSLLVWCTACGVWLHTGCGAAGRCGCGAALPDPAAHPAPVHQLFRGMYTCGRRVPSLLVWCTACGVWLHTGCGAAGRCGCGAALPDPAAHPAPVHQLFRGMYTCGRRVPSLLVWCTACGVWLHTGCGAAGRCGCGAALPDPAAHPAPVHQLFRGMYTCGRRVPSLLVWCTACGVWLHTGCGAAGRCGCGAALPDPAAHPAPVHQLFRGMYTCGRRVPSLLVWCTACGVWLHTGCGAAGRCGCGAALPDPAAHPAPVHQLFRGMYTCGRRVPSLLVWCTACGVWLHTGCGAAGRCGCGAALPDPAAHPAPVHQLFRGMYTCGRRVPSLLVWCTACGVWLHTGCGAAGRCGCGAALPDPAAHPAPVHQLFRGMYTCGRRVPSLLVWCTACGVWLHTGCGAAGRCGCGAALPDPAAHPAPVHQLFRDKLAERKRLQEKNIQLCVELRKLEARAATLKENLDDHNCEKRQLLADQIKTQRNLQKLLDFISQFKETSVSVRSTSLSECSDCSKSNEE